MPLKYYIKHTWPSGKVRYACGDKLCEDLDDATEFTLIEAKGRIKRSRDAKLVWDIETTKVRIK